MTKWACLYSTPAYVKPEQRQTRGGHVCLTEACTSQGTGRTSSTVRKQSYDVQLVGVAEGEMLVEVDVEHVELVLVLVPTA